VFENCRIDLLVYNDDEYRDPHEINGILKKCGFVLMNESKVASITNYDTDTKNFKKLLRTFIRSTQINENLILMKLGVDGQSFIDNVIPLLIKADVIGEVHYTGAGRQRRYKLNAPIQILFEKLSKP
jgi:hypothetical protein